MNPDDVNEPWGVLPDGISVGDRVEGMSCTDLRGRRTGTLVGAGTRGNSPSTVEILDDRDGSPSFVHAGSVKPLAGDLESAPAGSVSVPLPTPTPEREALRDDIAMVLAHVDDSGNARIPWVEFADAVMPFFDTLRAKVLELRQEAIRNGQRATDEFNRAESSFQELATTREERDAAKRQLDESIPYATYKARMKLAGEACFALQDELAAVRTRAAVEAARQLRAQAPPFVEGKDESEEDYGYRRAYERICDWLEFEFKPATPPAGSSPVPEEPTPTERVWNHGDPEPEDHPKVKDNAGDVWTYNDRNGHWYTPATMPFLWEHIARKWSPLVEIVPAPSLPEEVQP